jgi:hypothetical protein
MEGWCRYLGRRAAQLRAAVRAVGTEPAAVRRYLYQRFGIDGE